MNVVELEHVVKSFGSHTAVNDLCLTVPDNAIYGFIGPNGSGKTTTLRMIVRIHHPDKGSIRVLGSTSLEATNDHIGYLPEEQGLYKQMKVRDVLRFYAALKGVRDSRANIDVWLERFQLSSWADRRVESLSKGMAQKVLFIATVVARPRLVILDEPFSGLDPINAEILRDAVFSLKRDGATVIFSTHDMAVAERMCDSIFMIHKGRKVLDGALESIRDGYGKETIRVQLEEGDVEMTDLPGVQKTATFGRWKELHLERDVNLDRLLKQIMDRGKIRRFEVARPTLQEIFIRLAGSEIQDPRHV